MSQQEDRVVYHSALDFVATQDEVVLVDEADFFVLSDPALF